MTVGELQAENLVTALSRLVRSVRAVSQRDHVAMGAAGTPLGVLRALRDGDARPGDLATVLQVSPSVVSRAVAPLETAGLIVRVTDPEDARAARLSLTDRGRSRLLALQGSYVGQVRDLLADWSDSDAAEAVAILGRLESAILSADPAVDTRRRLLQDAQVPITLEVAPSLTPSAKET